MGHIPRAIVPLSTSWARESSSYFRFFYEGLEQSSKLIIDAAAVGGNLMNMSIRDAYKLIDEMSLGRQQWSSIRGPVRGVLCVIETYVLTKLTAQLKAMQMSIDRLINHNVSTVQESPTCAICGGGDHLVINCNWGGSAEGGCKIS
jgi:hypothetical protein